MKSKSARFTNLTFAVYLALGASHAFAADPFRLSGDHSDTSSIYIEMGDFSGVVNVGEDYKNLPFNFGEKDSNIEIVVDLPDLDTQTSVYYTLNTLGYVRNASKSPGVAELAALYQYAIDTGLLVDDKETINDQLAGVAFFASNAKFAESAPLAAAGDDSGSPDGAAKSGAICATGVIACIAGLVAVSGECAAIATPAAPFMTPTCYANSVVLVANCAGAVAECKEYQSTRQETKYSGSWADPDHVIYFEDDYQNAWCDGSNRVDKIQVYGKGDPNAGNYSMIRGIKLTCTNGSVKWVGSATGANDQGSSSCHNDPHHLPQGLRIRYDQGYASASAVGLICDPTADTTSGDILNTLKGGTRGTLNTYLCPEGRYLVGLSYVLDAYGFVEALGVTCRRGLAP